MPCSSGQAAEDLRRTSPHGHADAMRWQRCEAKTYRHCVLARFKLDLSMKVSLLVHEALIGDTGTSEDSLLWYNVNLQHMFDWKGHQSDTFKSHDVSSLR